MDQVELTNYAEGKLPYSWRVKRLLRRKENAFEAVDATPFRHELKASTSQEDQMKTFLLASLTLLMALTLSISVRPSEATAQEDLPYTFFFTHYELLGNPNSPQGVRYHSDGRPFAKAPDGSKITLSGQGGWDPNSKSARGGGRYTIEDASGKVTAKGSWWVTGFTSFEQLDGWWGMGPEFKEKGWQGPKGSTSFSGFLRLKVHLQNQGDGVLTAWCLMPDVSKPDDHQGDGISLTGANFDFTDFSESEKSFEGVMFYSSDPTSKGYVLTSDGHTVRKTAAVASTGSASASASAMASASPLPTSGGPSIDRPLTLVAILALVGSGAAALAILRRAIS